MSQACFVFDSNLQGIHGAGAAKEALEHWGAQWGVGTGLTGNSYALPTKATPYKSLPLQEIYEHSQTFLKFAETTPEKLFILTPVGCGLAGYKHWEIAPFFEDAPPNVYFPVEWVHFYKMYGTSF